MKFVLPGGSGQVGMLLARGLIMHGHEVVVLSRGATGQNSDAGRQVFWDGKTSGPWTHELEGADVVINLAGRSVNCRYTPENRQRIIASRVDSVRAVGAAIAAAKHAPRVWLQASTATIYAHRFDTSNDEANGLIGGAETGVPETWKFSIDVATRWENAALSASAGLSRTRLVLLRSAMVMSPDRGGIFDTLLALMRRGLGGTSGSGRQFVSWIHEADFVRAVDWLIARDDIRGAVNLAAPHPLPNAAFMRELREAWGTKFGLPASQGMLEIGAWFIRTETELILKSRRVVPGRLLEHGFNFEFPEWSAAARELCRCWRQKNL